VYWRGYLQETYDAVVLTADDPDLIDTRMANSAYVTAITLNHSGALTNGTVYFAGGDDGENVTESDVIGSVVGTTKTGLQLFSNAEEYDLNLLAVPGDSRKGVIAELLGIAEDRQDCMVLIDPPYGLDVDGIIKWHNGLGGGADDPTSALDSSYGSLTWPWVQTYDSWTDANIWTPPSGWVAGLMAASDANYEVWFATSGFRRGNLVGALDIEYSPNQGERTQLCGRSGTGGFNAINPFVKFSGQGIKRFDCLTLQRAATALNLEPVRRMLTYLRKMIATSSMYLLFEQNDWRLWTRFKNMVEPYLKSVQAREGLRDSLVVMDATTNTDDIIEQGICAGRIVLKPIKPDRIIQLTFVLTPQGANFTEYVV
jgi:phage tail sheath protein FI